MMLKKVMRYGFKSIILCIWLYIFETFNYLIYGCSYKNQFIEFLYNNQVRHTYLFIMSSFLILILLLETILSEKRKQGKWKFDVSQFIILGLPFNLLALFEAFYPKCFILFGHLTTFKIQLHFIIYFFATYFLSTSFYKRDKIQNTERSHIKRLLSKVVFNILILLLIIQIALIFNNKFTDYTYSYSAYFTNIIFLFGTLIGIVIGFIILLKEILKKGKWRFDFLKFIILSLPILLMVFVNIKIPIINVYGKLMLEVEYINFDLGIILSMLFGYHFITSFYKKENLKMTSKLEESVTVIQES